MSTDKEKLEAVFNELGIGYNQMRKDYLKKGAHSGIWFNYAHKGVDGYMSFYTQFEFDESGKFIGAGVWE